MREPSRSSPWPQIVTSAANLASLASLLTRDCSARSLWLWWSLTLSPYRTFFRGDFSTRGAFSIFLTVFFFLAGGSSPDGS
jgi:hypothetical protein